MNTSKRKFIKHAFVMTVGGLATGGAAGTLAHSTVESVTEKVCQFLGAVPDN